jgi:hypothetical protein
MDTSNTHEAVRMALQEIYVILEVEKHHNEPYGKMGRTLDQAICLAAIGEIQVDHNSRVFKPLDRSGRVNPRLFNAWIYCHFEHPVFRMWYLLFGLVTRHRRFMKLENGYFGFAHQDCQVGDVLVILGGGSVPYILQPLPTGNYTFIGTAYVQGMKAGEAFEMNTLVRQSAVI